MEGDGDRGQSHTGRVLCPVPSRSVLVVVQRAHPGVLSIPRAFTPVSSEHCRFGADAVTPPLGSTRTWARRTAHVPEPNPYPSPGPKAAYPPSSPPRRSGGREGGGRGRATDARETPVQTASKRVAGVAPSSPPLPYLWREEGPGPFGPGPWGVCVLQTTLCVLGVCLAGGT